MIPSLFLAVVLWAVLCVAEEGLRLARVKDGVVTLSSITKPEELSFDAPSHRPALSTVELLDIVLFASVDGRFHALNRTTSRSIWSMDDHRHTDIHPILPPLVKTSHVIDRDEDEPQELYIVEPQSGDIFVLPEDADRGEPLKRLPYTVPKLVDISPFVLEDPHRIFSGVKQTSIITLDLDTGNILRVVGSGHNWVANSEEGLDNNSRRKVREIQIGRTDYEITVSSRTGLLQTLSFSSYGPNNVDAALQAQWLRTPDDMYFQPSWDGTTYAFQTSLSASDANSKRPESTTAKYGVKYHHPIVAVFDVVHSTSTPSDHPRPIGLLQPQAKLQELFPSKQAQLLGIKDKTFVGRIGESLFAMGHLNYPLINLAQVPVFLQIEGHPNDEYVPFVRCRDLECYVGPRYTERDETQSRISRLLDSPEKFSKKRDMEEQNPLATAVEVAAVPSQSRPHQLAITAEEDNIRPPAGGGRALNWTLILPFIGGFFAIWLLLRKFIRLSPAKDGTELIRPLQNSREESTNLIAGTTPPMTNQTIRSPEGQGTVISYSPHIEKSDPVTMVVINEKEDVEESDREDKEGDSSKRKPGRRRRRGKKKGANAAGALGPNGEEDGEPLEVDGEARIAPSTPQASTSGGSQGYILVEDNPEQDSWRPQSSLSLPLPVQSSPASLVVTSNVLGYGSHGTIVFEGSLQGRAVAVKRLLHDFVTLAHHEVSLLQESDDHPNVIRYYYQEQRQSFLYIALELCPASLADLIERPRDFSEQALLFHREPKRALAQVTSGLRYLHQLKIVHRDIKPQNILVSKIKNGSQRMLISDFGLCKKLEVDQTSFLPTRIGLAGAGAGTAGWRAPEILRGEVSLDEAGVNESSSSSGSGNGVSASTTRLTKSVDIFALGCLFYYTLSNGDHPFGERYSRDANIMKGNYNLEALDNFGEEGVEAADLIESMIDADPKARPDTSSVLLHPFFWTSARRLAFLQDASDRFEIMNRDPPESSLLALEYGAFEIIASDWHRRLDKIFIEQLGKQRKYDGSKILDLLRAIRNKKHHYQDLPENVRRLVGSLPDGYLSYFTRKYPTLFIHVYTVVSELPLRNEHMFKAYFELDS